MYQKLTTYSLWCLWLSAICSVVFILTIIGNDAGEFNLFASKEDSSKYDFYNKKLVSRNDRNIKGDLQVDSGKENVESKIELSAESKAAIKNAMLRQSVKLESTIKVEKAKPIIKEKADIKPKPKSNDGFDIRPINT